MLVFAKAGLLGLSTGLMCMATCAPALIPILTGTESSIEKNKYQLFSNFLCGRLIAYLFVGISASLVGQILMPRFSTRLIGITFICLSIMLILFALVNGFPHLNFCKVIASRWPERQVPLFAGLLLGLNPCPPFIAGITDVMVNGHVVYGLLFFLTFFITTSLFLIPFVLFRFLARYGDIRKIGQLSALLSGMIYMVMGLFDLFIG
jgi:sulfite exporter TauE/SafE